MKFNWAYPIAHFEEGKWYESRNPSLPCMKVIKRTDKAVTMSDETHIYKMKIRKAWNDIEYVFHYTSSKENAYYATLEIKKEDD